MKKLSSLFFLLTIATLVGAGCTPADTTPTEDIVDNTPPVVIDPAPEEDTSDDLPDGWSHFENADLGLAFNYPTAWGTPTINEEEGQVDEEYNGCIYSRAVIFPEAAGEGANLLTAVSSGDCKAPGRGGQWSDQAASFTASTDVEDRCEATEGIIADECDTFTTQDGDRVWHWHYDSYDFFPETNDGPLENIEEYGLYNAGHPLTGVIASNEALVENEAADQGDNLRTLVESITFIN